MLTIELSINIFVFALILLTALLLGYAMRKGQIVKYRIKLDELEREILNNYAEILRLEKESNHLETQLKDLQIPVIPIKTAKKDDLMEKECFPDVSLRKKLLNQENNNRKNIAGK
jgi:cell division protein FtsB